MTMARPTFFAALTAALILGAGLSGCASFEKCDPANCAKDAQISTEVRASLNQHTEFGPPGSLRVQTINRVVYLNGMVDTDLDRRNAESITMQVTDVKDVVNSIDVRNNSR
jgi:osmotically-inducible protein OsmY